MDEFVESVAYLPCFDIYCLYPMDITFWKGICMGLLIALPTGAVSFIIIRRMYLFGMKSGMYSVAGSMISDLFYAIIVGFGLKTIGGVLVRFAGYAEVIVGIALIVTGYKACTETIPELVQGIKQKHPLRDLVSITLLNLMNPTLVLSFTTLFLLLGMQASIGNPKEIATFLVGISTGTLVFWYLLGRLVVQMRERNRPDMVSKINRGSGIVLGAIGCILLMLSIIHIIFPGSIK